MLTFCGTKSRRDDTRGRDLRDCGELVGVDGDQADRDDSTMVVEVWRFAGIGSLTSGDATLAVASAARARARAD